MNSKLITPTSVSVPAGISFHGLELPHGAGILSLRDLTILVSLHAILGRSSSTLAPAESVARLAVATADAVLASRSVPSPSPATPSGPAGAVTAD